MSKRLDCVAMKDAIHARMRKERKGMTDADDLASVRRWLATSNDVVATWWRKTAARTANGRGSCPKNGIAA